MTAPAGYAAWEFIRQGGGGRHGNSNSLLTMRLIFKSTQGIEWRSAARRGHSCLSPLEALARITGPAGVYLGWVRIRPSISFSDWALIKIVPDKGYRSQFGEKELLDSWNKVGVQWHI